MINEYCPYAASTGWGVQCIIENDICYDEFNQNCEIALNYELYTEAVYDKRDDKR